MCLRKALRPLTPAVFRAVSGTASANGHSVLDVLLLMKEFAVTTIY